MIHFFEKPEKFECERTEECLQGQTIYCSQLITEAHK